MAAQRRSEAAEADPPLMQADLAADEARSHAAPAVIVVPSFPLGRTLAGIVLGAFVVPAALMALTYGFVQLPSLWQATSPSGYASTSPARVELTLASFNLRFDGHASSSPTRRLVSKLKLGDAPTASSLEDEGQPVDGRQWGELSWSTRRHAVADIALFHNWDLFGLQEMLPNQLRDIVALLGAKTDGLPAGQPALPPLPSGEAYKYDWAGVPRNDGRSAGEAVPIFWKKELFERVPHKKGGTGTHGVEHFWLSPSGEPGSVGWDADQTRMCTHVALRLRQSPRQILHAINCHYDHKGLLARAESSKIVLRKAREAVQWSRQMQGAEGEEPLVVVLGDFNSPRTEAGWQNLVTGHHNTSFGAAGSESFTFIDAVLAVPLRFPNRQQPSSSSAVEHDAMQPKSPDSVLHARGRLSQPYGPDRTFIDFYPRSETAEQERIDFILLSDSGAVRSADSLALRHARNAWSIETAGVVPAWSGADAGWQVSDHHAVQVRIQRRLA